jgi:hypothetical protein
MSKIMNDEKWPEGFLIGAPKAGTTSLHAFFKKHRAFYVPNEKYLRYFARECHPGFCLGANEAEHRRLYLNAFANLESDKIRIDCDNATILNPAAASRISAARPDARIVAILRNPVDRAWSHYLSDHERGADPRNPTEALLGPPRAFAGMKVPELYILAGCYYRILSPFMVHFPRNQVLLINFEDMRTNAASTQERICRFFGVTDDPSVSLSDFRENVTLPARNALAKSLLKLRFTPGGLALRKAWQLLPIEFRGRIKESAFSAKRRVEMPAYLRQQLIEVYRPDAESLGKTFGFDISAWLASWERI